MTKNIAIFASGQGTNAYNIINSFKGSNIVIELIVTNNSHAGVIQVAKEHSIPFLIISKRDLSDKNFLPDYLKNLNIDMIVLAGFLWLIPSFLINFYKNKIINIHPALLPRYGGKGMYGMKVHESVKESGDKMSGITIHYVNEKYDEGSIIFQSKVSISNEDTAESIADKIHKLEYKYFPKVINDLLNN